MQRYSVFVSSGHAKLLLVSSVLNIVAFQLEIYIVDSQNIFWTYILNTYHLYFKQF